MYLPKDVHVYVIFFLNKTVELWRVWGYSPYISYTSYVKVFQVSNNQCWRFTKSTSLQHLPKLYYLSLWEIYQRLFYQDWEKSPLGPFFHYIGKTTAGEGDRGGFNGTITKNMLFNNSFYGELETTAYIGTPPPRVDCQLYIHINYLNYFKFSHKPSQTVGHPSRGKTYYTALLSSSQLGREIINYGITQRTNVI